MSKQIDGSTPASMLLKTKLQSMRDDLGSYKELLNTTNKKREMEIEKGAQLQSEVESLRMEVKEMNDTYAKLTEDLNEGMEKLTAVTKHADECERGRRALDHRRNMDIDRISLFETMIKETTENLRESEKNSEEAARKLGVVKREEERILKKNEAMELKNTEINSDLKKVTTKMKACQLEFEKFLEREEIYEKTIAEIQARINAANAHNDQVNEMVAKLKNAISTGQNELKKRIVSHSEGRKDLIQVSN